MNLQRVSGIKMRDDDGTMEMMWMVEREGGEVEGRDERRRGEGAG